MGISRTRALLPLAVMALASVVGFVIGRVTIGPGPPDSFPDQPLAAAKMTVGKVELPGHSPRKGPKAPKVTFVEISDFECAFCGKAAPAVKQMEKKYRDEVAFVFLHMPLSAHQYARVAAIASLAAARQGRFWDYRDALFANQKALAPADLEQHAAKLGLDVGRFRTDFRDPSLVRQLQADERVAQDLGVTGTPTFFINGRKVPGAQPAKTFEMLIDLQIRRANELMAKGTPLAEVSRRATEKELAH